MLEMLQRYASKKNNVNKETKIYYEKSWGLLNLSFAPFSMKFRRSGRGGQKEKKKDNNPSFLKDKG